MTTENIYEEIKDRITEAVDNIFIEMHRRLDITSGDVDPEMNYYLVDDIKTLARAVQLILEKQKKDTVLNGIETGYIPDMDITTIWQNTYNEEGKLQSREVVGFYQGEPDEEATIQFMYKGLVAKYEL